MVMNMLASKQKAIILIITIILSITAAIIVNNFYTPNTRSKATTSSPISAPITYNQSNISVLVKSFLVNTSRFYLRYRENSLVGNFCRTLILNGSIVNSTFILVSGNLYQYGVLAYMPPTSNYWFSKQLRLKDIVIAHIPPQENITLTGDFGPIQWFRISKNNITKIIWFTNYPGVVYKNKVICSSTTIELGKEHVVVVRAFIVVAENVPSLVESSLWLVLLPTGTR